MVESYNAITGDGCVMDIMVTFCLALKHCILTLVSKKWHSWLKWRLRGIDEALSYGRGCIMFWRGTLCSCIVTCLYLFSLYSPSRTTSLAVRYAWGHYASSSYNLGKLLCMYLPVLAVVSDAWCTGQMRE